MPQILFPEGPSTVRLAGSLSRSVSTEHQDVVDTGWGCWACVLGRRHTPSHSLVVGSHHSQLLRGGTTQTPSSEADMCLRGGSGAEGE